MSESVIVGIFAVLVMGIATAVLWRHPTGYRVARPMMILTALTLMHVFATYDGNLSDPLIRYTIVYPQRLVGLWAMFEIVRLWRYQRGPKPATK